jgi:hypothetical protein
VLSKQLIPLAFGQGLDTKRDKKQQLFGTLRVAENVVFETLDSARKRNGYNSILLRTTAGTSIPSAEYLSRFKAELLLFDQNKLYSFSEGLQAMQEKGNIYSVFPTSWPVLNNSYNHSQLDMLVVEGVKIFTYVVSATNEVRYIVQDLATQTIIVSNELVASSARTPKLANIGSTVFILYGTGTNIEYKRFDIANPALLTTAFTLVNNYDATYPNMDVVTAGGRIVVAYCGSNPAQRLSLVYVGMNNVPSTVIDFAGQDPTSALNLELGSGGRLIVSWASATEVKYMLYAANLLGSFLAPTLLETIANANKVAGTETSVGNYQFVYSIDGSSNTNDYTKKVTANSAGTVGSPTVLVRSVSLASKIFWVQSALYFLVSYDSVEQATYFVLDVNGTVVAKISPSTAGGHLATGTLPKAHSTASDTVLIPSLYKSKLLAENGEFFSLLGITNTELDFVVEDRYQNAALGNNLLIGGGIVQSYDGETVAEHGFHVYPEPPTLQQVTTGTPNNNATRDIADGDYGYCIVYRWTDNQGQEHRSAPSQIVNITVTGGPKAVEVTIPTLRLTQKENVVVEVYRTEDNGTLFYLANSATVPFFNDETVDTVIFLDGRPDANLISGRLLYTTGGVLENIAAPSARVLATHTASKRIFLAGLENPNRLQYSKITTDGQPVEFNDDLVQNVDPVGGEITALASMDEKLVIFESDAIFFISGTGPNNAGQQNTFTEPERVSAEDVGCLDPKSVVLTPDGLMFKSRKGIYLLNRALGLEYIGAPVEAFNALTISSAKVVAELNQVRFTTVDGDCLTYNYVYKFWATFTNHKALSAEVIGNQYYYLRTNKELYQENRQTFSDAGIPIKMRLEIGWISFTTLQGYARVYKMLVLGNWLSRHDLSIKVGYDFNEAWVQSATITPDTAQIDAVAYGDDSPYGEPVGKPYGGYGNPYQFRVNFKRQKCQSIKLLVEDVQENAGEGFSLSQITFQVGGKSGMFKLSKGKQFATS